MKATITLNGSLLLLWIGQKRTINLEDRQGIRSHENDLLLTVTENCFTAMPLSVGREGKKTGEFVLVIAGKAYWGSRSITPFVLNLGTRWICVLNFTLRPLRPTPSREGTTVPIE